MSEADSAPKVSHGQKSLPQADPSESTPSPVDRNELLEKARAFLNSPQVRHETPLSKRRFLAEKGLNDAEVDRLLQEQPIQAPLVPPRTYPQPPPSNLPNLLIGVARIASWIAGGSVAVLLLYFRFLYPRLAQSYQARYSIRCHQKGLLSKFTASLDSLKASQSETFAVLPPPPPYKEESKYQDCHTLDEILALGDDQRDIPDVSLLRCVIGDLHANGQKATTEAIFQALESKLPWLQSEEGSQRAARLWETLSNHAVFEQKEDKDVTSVWSYTPPTPPSEPPLLASLSALKSTLPEPQPHLGRFQYSLQALGDLTGYIASEIYTMPSSFRMPNLALGPTLSPQEEEVRREIRAIKGLVLNRRSFMPPAVPRPSSTPDVSDSVLTV